MNAARAPLTAATSRRAPAAAAGTAAWRTLLVLAGVAAFAAIALAPVLAPSPYGVASTLPAASVEAAMSPAPSADTGFSAAYGVDWRQVEAAPNPAPLAVAAYDD